MVLFGVCRLEDYRPRPAGLLDRVRRLMTRNRISCQLLRTATPATPADIERFEALIPNIRVHNGVYRFTSRRRFRDLDGFVNGLLADRYQRELALAVHDWAASDCLGSLEWAAALFERFPNATLTASDLALFLIDVRLDDGGSFILEHGGEPLQYVRRPFVIRLNPPEPWLLPVNRLLSARALSRFRRLMQSVSIPSEWIESGEHTLGIPPFELRKISLVHPDAEAARAGEPRFTIARHSVFDALPQPVDVIRTMNILNRQYFAPERLAAGVRAVWSSLKPGGLWIVGRTWREDPPTHNTSVLDRAPEGFRVLRQYGDGSEIEALAVESSRRTA
jgi:hypothetical protein